MVSRSGISIKRLVALYEKRNLPERFAIKIKNYFSYKNPISDDLKSFLVYKFTCASCSSSYIGKNYRHFKTRIEEHIKKDNKSHIFKDLHSTTTCFDSFSCHTFTKACVTPLMLSIFVFVSFLFHLFTFLFH